MQMIHCFFHFLYRVVVGCKFAIQEQSWSTLSASRVFPTLKGLFLQQSQVLFAKQPFAFTLFSCYSYIFG